MTRGVAVLLFAIGFSVGASAYAVIKAGQADAILRYQATLISSLEANVDSVKSQTTSALWRVQALENEHGRHPADTSRPAPATAP